MGSNQVNTEGYAVRLQQETACLGTEILGSLWWEFFCLACKSFGTWVRMVRMDSDRGLVSGPCIFGGMRKLYVFSFIHVVHS